MRQFLRKSRLTFFGSSGFIVNPADHVSPHEMRIAFNVSKTISGSANTFEVSVWNLNADHRNSIGKELDELQLECGYEPPEGGGNLSVIAKGFIRDVQHRREGSDIITTVSSGDGDKAHRKATISKTYPAGTPVTEVVEGIYERMSEFSVDRGEWLFPDDIRTTRRPYSMCGGCVRELNNLGRGNGFYWSIQNGVLEVIPSDGHLPGDVVITPDSGLVGTPTITDNGVKVSCLLNPAIRPNRVVQIRSDVLEMNAQDGRYRVSELGFSGDNSRGDFIATVHGESISDDGRVDEGVLK